jgi:hypothetical protein
MPDYTEREKRMLSERYRVEGILAEALGYTYDDEYGWVIGDHTIETLAIEVRRRGVRDDA